MSKIVIEESKANKVHEKLDMLEECVYSIKECLTESMEGRRNYEEDDDWDDDWDDEYAIKRRRARKNARRGMRRGMRDGMDDGSMSRY